MKRFLFILTLAFATTLIMCKKENGLQSEDAQKNPKTANCTSCPDIENNLQNQFPSWYNDNTLQGSKVRAPYEFNQESGLLSNNKLYKMSFDQSGHWHIISKCRLRMVDGKAVQGSIWNPSANYTFPSNIREDSIPTKLNFDAKGSLKVYNRHMQVLWEVSPLNDNCGLFFLELTDYGNLQIVSDCGKIMWESRTDTNTPEQNGYEYGYHVSNNCYSMNNETYTSCNIGCVKCPSQPISPTGPKGKIILPRIECVKTECLFPVNVPEICKYMVDCPGCGLETLCKGEFIFDENISDVSLLRIQENEKFTIASSKVIKNQTILKIPYEINTKTHKLVFKYNDRLAGKELHARFKTN